MSAHQQLAADVRDALRQSGIVPNAPLLDGLVAEIEANLETYQREIEDQATFREAHDALRGLFGLLESEDPPIGVIRGRMGRLPARAKRWIELRARAMWLRLNEAEFAPALFQTWMAGAQPDDLVRVLRTLVSEGGVLVEGRHDDRKARLRLEPVIMGTARGADDGKLIGGRSPEEAKDELVMNLALDWLNATEQKPALKRSSKTGFPGLVHSIFELYGITGAEQALRRYSEAVRGLPKARRRSAKQS